MPFDIKKKSGIAQVTFEVAPILQQLTNTRRDSYKLSKSLCSHDIYKYFFANRIVDLWNSLPNEVVSVQSLHTFKYNIIYFSLSVCVCACVCSVVVFCVV